MENTHSIEEYLNSLLSDIESSKFDAHKVWEDTAKRVHWSDMGFESESEYTQYLAENPYSNL